METKLVTILRLLSVFADRNIVESIESVREVAGIGYGVAWRYVQELSKSNVLKIERSGKRTIVAAGGNWVDQVGWIARAITAFDQRDIELIGVRGVVRVSVIPLFLAGHMYRTVKMWVDSHTARGALVGPDTEVPIDVVYSAAKKLLVDDLANLLTKIEEFVRNIKRREFSRRLGAKNE